MKKVCLCFSLYFNFAVASSVSLPSILPSNQASALPSPQSSAPFVAQPLVPPSAPPSTVPSLHFVPVIVPHNSNSSSTFASYGPLYNVPSNLLPTMSQNTTNLPFTPVRHPFNLVVLPQTMSPVTCVTQMPTVMGPGTVISQASITATTPSVTSPPPAAPAELPLITPAAPPSTTPAPLLMSFDDAPPVSVPWSLTEQPLNPTEPLLVDLPAFSGPRVSDAEPLSTSSALLDFGFDPLVFSPSSRNSERAGDADLLEYRDQNAVDRDGQSDGNESDHPRSCECFPSVFVT